MWLKNWSLPLTKRVRMLQDEFSRLLLGPPPADCFPPEFDTSTLDFSIKNRGFRDAWAQTTRPRALFEEPEWYDCPQTKNRVNQLGSRNFKGWNIKFQDTTFNYTPLKTNICPGNWWLEDHFSLSTKKWFPFLGKYVSFRVGGLIGNMVGVTWTPSTFDRPKTSTQRLRRIPRARFQGWLLGSAAFGHSQSLVCFGGSSFSGGREGCKCCL